MRFVAPAALTAALLLSACGQADKPAATDAPAKPAAEAAAAPAKCDSLPDFAPLYADAVVTGCYKGASTVRANHDSGTAIYTTKAAAAEVLGFYKSQAQAKGMADSLSAPTMYSARDGEKRSMMILTKPAAGGTQVTINWGRDTGA